MPNTLVGTGHRERNKRAGPHVAEYNESYGNVRGIMSELQIILVVALVALAVVMAVAFALLHRKEQREAATARVARRNGDAKISFQTLLANSSKKSYMEVWVCPHCSKLSRIARACKWCLHAMPKEVKFLTVPEKEYVDQFSVPNPGRNPSQGEQPAV